MQQPPDLLRRFSAPAVRCAPFEASKPAAACAEPDACRLDLPERRCARLTIASSTAVSFLVYRPNGYGRLKASGYSERVTFRFRKVQGAVHVTLTLPYGRVLHDYNARR